MTQLASVCPCCGTDIQLDTPILINDYSMNGAGHPLFYAGEQMPLTHHEALVCWSLMKAYPGHMTIVGLAERLGTETEDPRTLIAVHVSRIRKKLRDLGLPQPIQTMHSHHAYVWNPRGVA